MSFDVIGYLHHNNVTPKQLGIDSTAFVILKEFILFINQFEYKNKSNTDVWPSVEKIASRTGFSDRTVKRKLKILKDSSLLSYKRSNGNQYIYTVAVDNLVRKIKGILNLGDIVSPRNEKHGDIKSNLGDIVSPNQINNKYIYNINNKNNNNIRTREEETNLNQIPSSTCLSTNKEDPCTLTSLADEGSISGKEASKPSMVSPMGASQPDSPISRRQKNAPPSSTHEELHQQREIAHKLNLGQSVSNYPRTPRHDDRLKAIEIYEALMTSRRSFTNTDPGDKNTDVAYIANRLVALQKRGMTMKQAVDLCLEVVKYRHHWLSHLSGDFKTSAVKKYCARSVFYETDRFDDACKNLVKGKFYNAKVQAEEERKRREDEERLSKLKEIEDRNRRKATEEWLKQHDPEYIALMDKAEEAKRVWRSHMSSKEATDKFNQAQNELVVYQELALSKKFQFEYRRAA